SLGERLLRGGVARPHVDRAVIACTDVPWDVAWDVVVVAGGALGVAGRQTERGRDIAGCLGGQQLLARHAPGGIRHGCIAGKRPALPAPRSTAIVAAPRA